MRRIKYIAVLAFFTLTIMVCSAYLAAPFDNLKAGDKLDEKLYNVPPSSYAVDIKTGDVTGDKVPDKVILSGTSDEGESMSYYKNIKIIVIDGKTNKLYTESIGYDDSGYEPKLVLGDFNGDKIKDAFVDTATGGSGGTHEYGIYSFKDNVMKILFDRKDNGQGISFDVKFLDNFKLSVKPKEYKNYNTIINLANNKKLYIDNHIYYKNGKLVKKEDGAADGYGLLIPTDKDGDGVLELTGYQRIWGFVHVNSIVDAVSTWKWVKDGFKLTGLKYKKVVN